MKAVIQRVTNASVTVDGKITGAIDLGLLVYLGVAAKDSEKDAQWMAEKAANLRIFNDSEDKMNLSLLDLLDAAEKAGPGAKGAAPGEKEGGQIEGALPGVSIGVLAVSQFTLLADARKGRRPYYGDAADPEKAKYLYEYFMDKIREQGLACEAGVFQAMMEVSYTNQGPVTIILDSGEI